MYVYCKMHAHAPAATGAQAVANPPEQSVVDCAFWGRLKLVPLRLKGLHGLITGAQTCNHAKGAAHATK